MASHILINLQTFPFFSFASFFSWDLMGIHTDTVGSSNLFKVAFEFSYSENFKRHFSSRIEIFGNVSKFLEIFRYMYWRSMEIGNSNPDQITFAHWSILITGLGTRGTIAPLPQILAELGAKPSEDIVFLRLAPLDFQTFHHLWSCSHCWCSKKRWKNYAVPSFPPFKKPTLQGNYIFTRRL